MPKYVGSPDSSSVALDRLGVLLVNLGTPDAPTPAAVRRFLAEFLGDPRVVESPRWFWLPVLHGVILRIRPRRSARAYREIWTEQGSPLMVFTQALAARLRGDLERRLGTTVLLEVGMTYGNPSIASALDRLRAAGATRIIVVPLYPQYSGTTTASVFDRVASTLQRWRRVPQLQFIAQYHDAPAYIEALAASIERHWEHIGGRHHLVLSYHGIPQSYVDAGDPYFAQCERTSRLLATRLGLGDDEWTMSFQSQVGRAEWLRPYTDELLTRYAREGRHRDVTVACPGFAIDCLETLEEIALRNRETFLTNGGGAYSYVPALNDNDAHVALLGDLIARHAHGAASMAEANAVERERAQRTN